MELFHSTYSDKTGLETKIPYTAEEVAAHIARSAAHQENLPKIKAQQEILRLEAQITPRRRDEAILQIDNGWLAAQRELINNQRSKL